MIWEAGRSPTFNLRLLKKKNALNFFFMVEPNDEICSQVRELILQNKKSEEIISAIQIAPEVFHGWLRQNYLGFQDKVTTYRHEYKLSKAEDNIDELLDLDARNSGVSKSGEVYEFTDPRLVNIKKDTTFFVAETLGKAHYTKRNEISGPDGRDIVPPEYVADVINKLHKAREEGLV